MVLVEAKEAKAKGRGSSSLLFGEELAHEPPWGLACRLSLDPERPSTSWLLLLEILADLAGHVLSRNGLGVLNTCPPRLKMLPLAVVFGASPWSHFAPAQSPFLLSTIQKAPRSSSKGCHVTCFSGLGRIHVSAGGP